MDWPLGLGLCGCPTVISPWSACSIANCIGTMGVPASAVWPTANKALYVPFRIGKPVLVKKLFLINGATVSGNVDVGIYDAAGTRLISAGSTAQAGASALQQFDIADTLLGWGLFYMALAVRNVTATALGTATLVFSELHHLGMGMPTSAFLPLFGLAGRVTL